MTHFELHVCRNGNWKRLENFEDRDAVMSAAIRIEQDRSHSALKVIREVFNESSKVFETKLLHKWSDQAVLDARNRETDQSLERQRQQRQMIRQRTRSNKPGWKARIKYHLAIAATAIAAIAGVVALMMVIRGV